MDSVFKNVNTLKLESENTGDFYIEHPQVASEQKFDAAGFVRKGCFRLQVLPKSGDGEKEGLYVFHNGKASRCARR